MLPLEVVGFMPIPPAVLEHRFVREALACAKLLHQKIEEGDHFGPPESVVGTANTGQVELYGWAPNVANHKDCTGYVYLCALNEGETMIEVLEGDESHSVKLPQGAVARLNDNWEHWTIDLQVRVCAFIGAYSEPCDEAAVQALQLGIQKLAAGLYYGAPRVRDGFRAYLSDECLVPNDAFDACEPMLLADAKAQDKFYERCGDCDKPAVALSPHWPYNGGGWCHDHR